VELDIANVHRRKYRALANAPVLDWGWHVGNFKSECLRPTAEAFQTNIIRIANFAKMPAWIALEAKREQLWLDDAIIQTGGKIEPDLTRFASQDVNPKAVALVNQRITEWRDIPIEVFRNLMDQIGIDWVEARGYWSQAISLGIAALFETIIVETWTAFEMLCKDLWIATLDNDNGSINTRVEDALRNKNALPTSNSKAHLESFQTNPRQLVFQKLKNIKKFYSAAFGPNAISHFDNVESGYITVLNAFRNVIVHKRGKVDRTFLVQVKDFSEFNAIKDGDEIRLDGEAVAKMSSAALLLGQELIKTADVELQSQKRS
jgi:hypothetical protein